MNGILNIQVRVLSQQAQAMLKQLEKEIAAVDKALDGQGGATRRLAIAQEHNTNTTRALSAANKELAAAQRASTASAKVAATAAAKVATAEVAYQNALMKSTAARRAHDSVAAGSAAQQAAEIASTNALTHAKERMIIATNAAATAEEKYLAAQAAATAEASEANINRETVALRNLEKALIEVDRATRHLTNTEAGSATQRAKAIGAANALAKKEQELAAAERAAASAAEALSAAHVAAATASTEQAAAAQRLAVAEREAAIAEEQVAVATEAVVRARQQATVATQAEAAAAKEAAAIQKLAAAEQAAAAKAAAAASTTAAAATAGAAGGLALAGNNMRKFGSQTQWAGRQLSSNFTIPVVLAGGLATKFALDNERAMTRVRKVYGELGMDVQQREAELNALGRAFEMLSNHFGVQQSEVLDIAGAWAAAGAAGRGLAEGVKNTLETMILGEIEAAEATTALIAIQSQYDLSTKQLSKTIGELNIIENQTGASLSDLITGFSRAAGMANLVGVDTRHLGAMIAALVPAAGSAANAGNSLKTVFARLVAPTKEARQILERVGLATDEVSWKNSNAVEKLEAINKKYYEYGKAQRGVIAQTLAGTYQVSRFAELMDSMHGEVNNGTRNLSQYEKALAATADQSAYMRQKEEELQTVLQSNPQKMKQVWVVLQNTLARAIIPAIPAIIMMAGMVQQLFEKFQELPPYVRKAILAFVLFAAVMGPILRLIGSFILLGGYIAKIFWALGKSGKFVGFIFRRVLLGGIMAVVGAVGAVPVAIGAAIAAVLVLLWKVPGVAEQITVAVHKAFNALPAAVAGPMLAVYRIVKQVVLAVYNLFSYLNPFAKHSPSLVENVTRGMEVVRNEFATLSSISNPINKAYADIKKFKDATAELRNGLDSMQRAKDLEELVKLAPGAVDEFRALVRDLQVLTPMMERLKDEMDAQQKVVDQWDKKLENANDALDKQQDRLRELNDEAERYRDLLSEAQDELDRFASAPITGMRAMEDQIFANEMAQKALRLEMMNLEDVNGPFDDLSDRLSKLAGEIEYLKGEQTSLRQAGAGSDVLATYDQQIAALEEQSGAIGETAEQYNELQAQLDALQRAGERLDLEKSLNFDGLLRQIEQTAHVVEELPFDQIMAGISNAKTEIDKYELALEKANNRVADQEKKVDAAQKKVDQINASYEAQRDKLDAITEKYDEVREAVDAVTNALSDMISAVEEANRQGVKKKKGGGYVSNALENFNAAEGGDFADVGGTTGLGREGGLPEIEDFIREMEAEQADLARRIDLFKPLRDKVNDFKGWWKRNVTDKWDDLMMDPVKGSSFHGPVIQFVDSDFKNRLDGFKNTMVDGINDGVAGAIKGIEAAIKFISPIVDLFSDDFKDFFEMVENKGREAIAKIWPELKKFADVGKPLLEALRNIGITIGAVALAIGVALVPVIGAIIGAIKIMASILTNVFGPVWTFIIETIQNFVRVIRGMIELVTGVLTGDWSLAWQGIRDIFGSMFDQMVNIITTFPAVIWAIIKGFVEGVRDFFVWLWDVLVGHSIIPDMINAIVNWFKGLPGKILGALAALGQKLWDLIKAAWDMLTSGLKSAWTTTWDFIKSIPQKIWDGIIGAANFYYNIGSKIINKVKEGLVAAWDAVKTWIGEKVDWIVDKFTGIKDRMARGFVGMFDGIKEAFKSAINFIINGWNRLEWRIPEIDTHIPGIGKVGGMSIGTPDIPLLAKGGVARAAQPYIVGERGPEFFVPSITGRVGSNDALQRLLAEEVDRMTSNLRTTILSDTVKAIAPEVLAGTVARADARVGATGAPVEAYQPVTVNNHTEYHFHGDLSFPNITSGDDAEKFLTNLSDLAG